MLSYWASKLQSLRSNIISSGLYPSHQTNLIMIQRFDCIFSYRLSECESTGLLMTHDSYNGLAGATLIIIIIEVSLCVEKWSVITYKFEVIGLCLSISIFYYFILPSATVWRQTLNFLVHYIYLISFVTSYSVDCLLHQSQAAYFLFNLSYQQSDKEHFIDSDNQINAEWLSVPIHAMFLNIVCIIYFYFGYSSKKNFPEKVLWYL